MKNIILIFTFLFVSPLKADPLKMAVIGNSVSQGTNIFGIGIWPDYNWSSGRKIDSHLMKLERERHVKVEVENVSIVGATSCLMEKEIKFLKHNFKPDYATIEIGTNDLCLLGFNTDIAEHIKNTIDGLLEKNEQMEIVVSPIPNVTSMYEAIGDKTKCKILWNLMCPRLLASWLTKEERQEKQKEIDKINDDILDVVEHYLQVNFNRDVGNRPISANEVSEIDCFHPSVDGQQAYSDETWN